MGTNSAGTGTFAQTLAALKRSGCGLLVVGAAPDTGVGVCRRLLGDAVADPRRRVVVLAGGTPGVAERLPESDPESDTGTLRVVDRREPTRSAAAASARPFGLDVGSLETDVERAIAELEPDGGFGRAELRVCLDSAGAFLDANGTESTRRLLAGLCENVRDHDGMFHAHLPLPYGNETARTLAGPFDAVVELRPGEQRWHVPDEGISTDWLSV